MRGGQAENSGLKKQSDNSSQQQAAALKSVLPLL